MESDEIYDDIDVHNDENIKLRKKRKRKFHTSEYVSKKRERVMCKTSGKETKRIKCK